MTRILGPYAVEVHFIECPAAASTFEQLDRQGTPYTAVLVTANSERRVLAKYGHRLMPTVLVWRGTEPYRHVYMSLDGFNPDALRTIHRLLQENPWPVSTSPATSDQTPSSHTPRLAQPA